MVYKRILKASNEIVHCVSTKALVYERILKGSKELYFIVDNYDLRVKECLNVE